MRYKSADVYPQIDGKKLEKLLALYCNGKGITLGQLSEELGFSRCFFRDAIKSEKLNRVGVNFLKNTCGIDFSEYEKNPKEKEEPAVVEKTEIPSENSLNKEIELILNKIDALESAINKLGNIEMQQLEYLKAIKDKSFLN